MKSRVRCFLLLLSLVSSLSGWAQTTPDVGNPWKELWASLAPLNASRIPPGVLLNRTVLITNPYRYAGQGDTIASYATFEQQYWEFFHAALDTTRLTTLAALRSNIDQRVRQGPVPLLIAEL